MFTCCTCSIYWRIITRGHSIVNILVTKNCVWSVKLSKPPTNMFSKFIVSPRWLFHTHHEYHNIMCNLNTMTVCQPIRALHFFGLCHIMWINYELRSLRNTVGKLWPISAQETQALYSIIIRFSCQPCFMWEVFRSMNTDLLELVISNTTDRVTSSLKN